MEYKKCMFIIMLAIFLLSITGVCASDVNDTWVASEDTQITDEIIQASENHENETQGNDDDGIVNVENDGDVLSTGANDTVIISASDDDEVVSVENDLDELSANPTNPSTFSELSLEIRSGGKVELVHDYYRYDGSGSTINIIVPKSVIDGKGAVIDMAGSNIQPFYVTASVVTFKNLTIKNANYTGDGGAIYFRSSGIVSNCNFTDNIATVGGAVYFEAQGTVKNCNFTNNAATSSFGGAIRINSGTVENCNFTNNTASYDVVGGGGGAILMNSGTVTNCNFTNNSGRYGGAVFIDSQGTVKNCNFTDNTAFNRAGAVYFRGLGTVENCNFTNNSLTDSDSWGGAICFIVNGNVTNCYFDDNSATYGGAVFFNSGGDVSNCNFVNNTASEHGGAVFFNSGGDVSNCNFINNHALYYNGGAIYFEGSGTVTNCNYDNNSAGKRGGAVFIDDNGAVINCNFTNNSCGSSYEGAAVFFRSNGNLTNCNFINNSGEEGIVYFACHTANNVANCNFTNNVAKRGGGIYIIGGDIANCNFVGNKVDADGGAVYIDEDANITDCKFINNKALHAFGGAVFFYKNGTIANCNFINNSAVIGGAICYDRRSSTSTVVNCNFTNNTASYSGGAVYFFINGEVINCDFTGNNAIAGSAIYFSSDSSTKTISNSCFLNNRANAEYKDFLNSTVDENNIDITFRGQNNLINAIYSAGDVNFTDVTYWGAKGIVDTAAYPPSRSNNEAGQNITVRGYVNGNVLNTVKTTDDEGKIVLDDVIGDYWIIVSHISDLYYTGAEKILTNMKLYVNVTETETTNKTVNITAKSNIYNEIMPGKLLFILSNGLKINATYASNGTWWAEHTFDDYANYQVNASYIGLNNVIINNATISITKANSTVNVSDVVLTYGESKEVTVTTTGATGITAKIDNNPVSVINNYTIPISSLNAGNYTLTVTTIPDEDHNPATKTVNITVNKAGTEIILTNETLYLKAGDVVSDLAKLNPADAGNLTFQSSNEDVAIAYDGIILARVKGNVTVTVSFAGNDNYAPAENKTITVYITPKDANVSVENETLDLNVDDKYEFNPTVNPSFLAVQYTSSNVSVAVVTDYGFVRAVGEGTAIITLTVGNDQTYAINTTNVTVTVSKVPTEISLVNASVDLYVLDEIISGATLTPADAGNLTYISGNESVAIVKNGKIMAVSAGQAVITVSFAGDDKYAAAENRTITVNVSLRDVSVNVNKSTLNLFIDDTFTVVATTSPDGLNVSFVPDDSGVYSVDENGVVTALKEGVGNILVKVGGDGVYAENSTTVAVTVSKVPTEIVVSGPAGEMSVGAMGHVTAELNPSEAGKLSYTSNDTSVVNVSSTGVIKANKIGTAIITVSFNGTDKYAACESKNITITVKLRDVSVNVNKSTLNLFIDDTFTVVATTSPDGLNVSFVPDDSGVYSVDENGVVTALKEGVGNILVKVGGDGVYAENSTTVAVTVSKVPTEIVSSAVTTVYNSPKNLIVTLNDACGKPISGANITVDLNGAKTYTTDNNGQVKISTKGLVPKYYTAKITFNGNDKYNQSAKNVKVTIKKATPKITAKAKTFKTTTKNKKYTITLKDNKGKPIKKATVYLKVAGKTYKATTNSKGQATFNLKKLTQKGTYKATITYKGNKYYNKATKKVNIKVKPIWKTVSKGSKNKAIVKIIQRALKNNGYYLVYNGHYLMVDGIFWDYTEMAVKEFQNDKKLKVTGKVDEKTAKKLKII